MVLHFTLCKQKINTEIMKMFHHFMQEMSMKKFYCYKQTALDLMIIHLKFLHMLTGFHIFKHLMKHTAEAIITS